MKKTFFLVMTILFLSCEGSVEENIVQTFIIASETRTCFGPFEQQCLLTKENEAQASWDNFYNPIIGFDHESGFEYVVRVNREYLPENADLQDSSVYEYTLLEIISKEEKTSQGL